MYYRNIRYIIYTALYPKHSMGLQYMPTLGWCQRGQLMRIYGSPMGRVWVYIYIIGDMSFSQGSLVQHIFPRAPTTSVFEDGWGGCQGGLTTEPEDMGQEPYRDSYIN